MTLPATLIDAAPAVKVERVSGGWWLASYTPPVKDDPMLFSTCKRTAEAARLDLKTKLEAVRDAGPLLWKAFRFADGSGETARVGGITLRV